MKLSYMRILALAGVFILSSASTMLAQSVATSDSSTADPASTTSPDKPAKKHGGSAEWNGVYVGGVVGFGLRRAGAETSVAITTPATNYFAPSSVTSINSGGGRQSLNGTKFSGGGTFGYNHQSGNWVVGAETDLTFQPGTSTTATTTTYPCCSPAAYTVTQSVKNTWLLTARPRLGYAWGKTMAYVTGGLAVSRINYAALFTDNYPSTFGAGANAHESGGSNTTKVGWTGGGGFETKVNSHWSIKGEYLYVDLRRTTSTSTNLTAQTPPTGGGDTFTHSIAVREHVIRFGFNYHF
ncbi:MAG: porin family protein [Acidobacteria bacterium]|nr:porin family protein [Acidobacteriota bacterium]